MLKNSPNAMLKSASKKRLLGGISVKAFLKDYWQKKPLLIRNAISGFGPQLERDGLLNFCQRDDVESRYVAHNAGKWELLHGPFTARQIQRWKGKWTVLVQGVNLVLPDGDALLDRFDFIPRARLDDLMVSYATDGGGVGPHTDNYDVFLLQGQGQRLWRVGRPRSGTLVDGAPLKILKTFKPDEEYLLDPGDMLYLPPDWGHDGIAKGECMTWSIGFRTIPADEMIDRFLSFLQDDFASSGRIKGRYADPDLKPQKHAGQINSSMVAKTADIIRQVSWNDETVRNFLGLTLTEPKPHIFFNPPEHPMSRRSFLQMINRDGLYLDARTRMLFSGNWFYLNGEKLCTAKTYSPLLRELANTRCLPPALPLIPTVEDLLYEWYCDGFVHPGRRTQ